MAGPARLMSMPGELILFRHAEAAPAVAAGADFARSLTAVGCRTAAAAAIRLAGERRPPVRILHSTAARAAETARIVAAALELPAGALLGLEDLYLANAATLQALVESHATGIDCLAIVGHNPGLSEFGARLDARHAGAALPTAGYWRIRLPGAGHAV